MLVMDSFKDYVVTALVGLILGSILCIGVVLHHYKHPLDGTKPCDYVDGYIVTSVINDNQFYGKLPNDDTEYLVTVYIKNMNIKDILFTSVSEWIKVSDAEIADNTVELNK